MESGRTRVLIGFVGHPGDAELATVRGLGGTIRYVYELIPVLAADVPGTVVAELRRAVGALYVEPDSQVFATDAELDATWGVKRIGAGVVHDETITGTGVVVAIIDTGIDYTHLEFTGRYDGGYDFVNSDDDPMDDAGHGTHVAGTVAAADDGEGVVGVAPGALLLAYKVLDENGRGLVSDVIAAIAQAFDDGAQVINMSLSGRASVSLKAACDAVYSDGVVLVAAAGNTGNPPARGDNVGAPAMYPSVIAVSATDASDERARWSSTGETVELAAPGVSILSTYLGEEGYATMSGTSMSAPHVAGTVALLIGSGVTDAGAIRDKLNSTSEDLGEAGWDPKYGYGLVNADGACGLEDEEPPASTGSMHVAEMVSSLVTTGPLVRALVGVKIVDEAGDPVEGSNVSGQWHDPVSGSASGLTGADGWVSFRSDKVRNPEAGTQFTFCVDVVTKPEWTYDSSANVSICSSSTVNP